jgi:vacuolar-type H+-ATPase subunit C/Vma6
MIRLVTHWSGQRALLLAPLNEDEDRRSIRAMLRGAAAGVSAEQRMAGLVPTPSLPERALAQLAALPDPASVGALLATWGNPYGTGILEEARRQQPDMFRLETGLTRTYASRSHRIATRCGRAMHVFVQRVIDLENLWASVLIAETRGAALGDALFAGGGALLTPDLLRTAAQARTRGEAVALLLPFVTDSPLAVALTTDRAPEERVLRALIREQHDIARLDPLGPAPIIEFCLRVRAELMVLRRVVWGVMLAAPAERLLATDVAS